MELRIKGGCAVTLLYFYFKRFCFIAICIFLSTFHFSTNGFHTKSIRFRAVWTNYSFQEFKLECFFFSFLFDRQCYWLGGERMVDPVWERYAGRRKGLINGAFFRINVSYIKKIERDSSIWYILDKAFCLILEYIFGSVFYEFARNVEIVILVGGNH